MTVWVPVIAAAISAAAGIHQTIIGQRAQSRQENFQKAMASTAHQREMEDMRQAGLNPILSGKYGGSATPPGAGLNVPNIGADDAVNTGLSAWRMMEEAKTQKTVRTKMSAEAEQAATGAQVNRAQKRKIQAEAGLSEEELAQRKFGGRATFNEPSTWLWATGKHLVHVDTRLKNFMEWMKKQSHKSGKNVLEYIRSLRSKDQIQKALEGYSSKYRKIQEAQRRKGSQKGRLKGRSLPRRRK